MISDMYSSAELVVPAVIGQLLFCRRVLDESGQSLAAAYVDTALRCLFENDSDIELIASSFELTLGLDYSNMDELIEKVF